MMKRVHWGVWLLCGLSSAAWAQNGAAVPPTHLRQATPWVAVCDHQSAHTMSRNAERELERLQAEMAELDQRRRALQSEYDRAVKAFDEVAAVRLPVGVHVPEGEAVPSRALLERLAQLLQSPRWRHERVVIEGHAERQAGSSAEYSLRTTLRMAEGVRRHLSEQGIAADRLEVMGMGDTKARQAEDPSALTHRRVVVKVAPR